MTTHVVALRVTPCLGIECKFWLGDDGWNGSSEHPSITVQAGSFGASESWDGVRARRIYRITFGQEQGSQ